MELTTLQIDILKSLAGLLITGGIFATAAIGIKLAVDKLPNDILTKLF